MDSPVPGHAPVVLNSQNIKLSYKHMRSESRVENQLTIWDALMTSLTLWASKEVFSSLLKWTPNNGLRNVAQVKTTHL